MSSSTGEYHHGEDLDPTEKPSRGKNKKYAFMPRKIHPQLNESFSESSKYAAWGAGSQYMRTAPEEIVTVHGDSGTERGNDPMAFIDVEQPTYEPKDKEECFTNDPHPAMETPLLYFMIRPFPCLLRAILSFYNLRWDISYPLQNRIPCSRLLRKIGIIMTWSDLLLLLPFFIALVAGIVYSTSKASVSISGHLARIPLIFTFVTATKNNILTFFLGIPVERAIKYHKLAARLAYINGLMHTIATFNDPIANADDRKFGPFLFQDSVNGGGTMIMFFMTGMIITALPFIRKRLFELFYFVHVIFAISMMGCAFYHTGIVVPVLGSLTWGLDYIVRKVYMPFYRYPRKATLQIISDSVIELSFPKTDGFDFNPGQYIYIAVPKLSYLEWHPFSLSSSPKQKVVSLHIRMAGTWTKALYALAQSHSDIEILMEGPYGSVGVDFTNTFRYQNIMLFSGGIGVTPMQSLCNSLMHEHNNGVRKINKLSFVWIERDPVVIPEVDVVRREGSLLVDSSALTSKPDDIKDHNENVHQISQHAVNQLHRKLSRRSNDGETTDFATHLLALSPKSRQSDRELSACFDTCNFDTSDDESDICVGEHNPNRKSRMDAFKVEGTNATWSAGDEHSIDQSFFDHAFQNHDLEELQIDLQVYLTDKNLSQATKTHVAELPFIHFGRPDLKNIFLTARQDAFLTGRQTRIAVCVCAPPCIVDLCRAACARFSDRYVTFDFHYEVFE
jgi:predicted ferric reductase